LMNAGLTAEEIATKLNKSLDEVKLLTLGKD